MISFRYFIRTEREKRNWTQTKFGAKIGINTSAISRIENEAQIFNKFKLQRLTELFTIDIQYVKDLFFTDKLIKEAIRYKCSDSIFSVAEKTVNYYKISNSKQGDFKFDDE